MSDEYTMYLIVNDDLKMGCILVYEKLIFLDNLYSNYQKKK